MDEERREVVNNKISPYIFAILLLVNFTALEWLRLIFNTHPNPWLLTIIAMVISIYAGIKIVKAKGKLKDINLGYDGEGVNCGLGILGERLRGMEKKRENLL